MTNFADHLLGPDDHASRPAANAVPEGAFYSCTDHGKIYQSDGVSVWSDYFEDTGGTAYTPGGTDVPIADGGTGASTAATARDNLGLEIGVDIPSNAQVTAAAAADYAPGGTDVAVADGGTGASSAGTARTNLGITAANTPITDSGNYYTGTDVEAALQEVGAGGGAAAHIADTTDAHDASAISIVDSGAYFAGTDVEAALQELGAGGGGGGGGGGAGSVLGTKVYDSGSDSAWATTSSGTDADIDATNAAITVTVGTSGKVIVEVGIDYTTAVANTGGYLTLRVGSTTLQAIAIIPNNVAAGGIGGVAVAAGRAVVTFVVSGLTPGATTFKIGFYRIGTTTLNVYAHDGTGASGHLASPFTIVVYDGGTTTPTIVYPSLKSAPTDDFDTPLSGWTAVQTGGTFTITPCIAQTLDGSHLFIPYYGNCGFLYIATTNVDQEWIAGGVMAPTRGGNYFYGIAILDSSNNGVALIFHSSDNTGALVSITAGVFDSVQATTTPTAWGTFIGSDTKLWLRLTRTGNTWDSYVSIDGVNWNESTSTINKTITASRCAIGAFLNATAIGALYADWVKKV